MARRESGDTIVAHDRGGRRRFILRGAALVATGAAAVSARQALAADCDRYSNEERARCSDSDSSAGAGGDPAICGCPADEVPARYEDGEQDQTPLMPVARVR